MTITVWPVDAVAGAPNYTGRMLRQTNTVAFSGATSARPLGARSGVRPGTPSTTVTSSSSTFTINPHAGLLDLETALQASAYAYSIDAAVTGSVTAANASNPRVDIIYVQLNDPAESDGSSTPGLSGTYYLAGTAAASPVAPATPARAMVLAQLNVPVSGGGSPTVTWVAPYLTAAGAERPVSAIASAGSGNYDGEPAWDQTTHQAYRWSAGSTAWQLAADPAVFTGGAAYTPVWSGEGGGSASLGTGGTLVGRYKQTGKIVVGSLSMLVGTGATGPAGIYNWTLPVAAALQLGASVDVPIGTATYYGGTVVFGGVYARYASAGARMVLWFHGLAAQAQSGNPSGWGSGVRMSLEFHYEAA